MARVGTPPTEWDISPLNHAASAVGSSPDDLELDIEFPVTADWGYELGLVEERPTLCPSPRALLPRPGWDDELQKPGAQVYMHFMQEHTCYDAMATSSKLVIFDITLEVRPWRCPHLHPHGAAATTHTLQDTPLGTLQVPFQNSFLAPWRPVLGRASLPVILALPFSISRILG